ncbi:glutamyl endopeptidase [Marininema mesophilum]|uniref:Serine protease n=2 Tax=Marininema mesophilum TaxID=1048340 RepID=A0A1H3BJ80_9BACL|nr:glutamyl endopeptidase [Marininema mesophilum]
MVSNEGTITAPTKPSSNSRKRDGATTSSYKGTGETVTKQPSTVTKRAEVKNNLPFIGVKSIIGSDDRVRVNRTTSFPYSAIVQISSDIGDCTGWFINADTIVTAGHCVYNIDTDKWATGATITPGRDRNNAPFGTVKSKSFHSVEGWITNKDTNYDYAAIKINSDIGNKTGWFGLNWKTVTRIGSGETMSGYPRDKDYGTQWRQSDKIRQVNDKKLYYTNDTNGQSGSPVYQKNNHSIAIHTDGGNPYNQGIRINEDVFNNLMYWKDH